MTTLPTIQPTLTTYEVWRWRVDVQKWTLVATKRTVEEARERVAKDRALWNATETAKRGYAWRITESVLHRTEVE